MLSSEFLIESERVQTLLIMQNLQRYKGIFKTQTHLFINIERVLLENLMLLQIVIHVNS
jgi:hypothetical protein